MSDFKLRSYDDICNDFISSLETPIENILSDSEPADIPAKTMPEHTEDSVIEEFPTGIESKPSAAEQIAAQSIYTKSEPTVHFEEEPDYDDDDALEKKFKKSKGAIAGEVVSIVMLALTVLVFVIGCFISIFLDNNGQAIAGKTFNTVAVDIDTLNLSSGDLVIAKKADASAFEKGKLIVIPYPEADGCNVVQITDTLELGNTKAFILREFSGKMNTIPSYDNETCYGLADTYIPLVGGLVSFAMQNAILVCALFILLAALWCLVLVLIEKTEAKKRKIED